MMTCVKQTFVGEDRHKEEFLIDFGGVSLIVDRFDPTKMAPEHEYVLSIHFLGKPVGATPLNKGDIEMLRMFVKRITENAELYTEYANIGIS